MTTGGEGPLTAVSDDQFTQLIAAIHASQERIDYNFVEFRAEMKQGQEDAAAKALKFRRKGNEEQATFNEKVEEVVAEVQAELSDVRS